MSNSNPVFIVGVGRSGTSLLHSMLAAHSQLAFPPETRFIRRYLAKGRLTALVRNHGAAAAVRELEGDVYFRRTGLTADNVVASAEQSGRLTDASIYVAMLEQYAETLGRRRIGDKDPRSVEYLQLLATWFPNAYVVHIIRDPRDVLHSRKRADWSSGRILLSHIFASRVQMAIGRRLGPLYFSNRYYELIYERLLANPEQELRRLCVRLGLEYEHKMLDFQETSKRLVTESELPWKTETLGPLLRNNSGKWKNGLSKWEATLVERLCAEAMAVGEYEAGPRLSSLPIGQRVAHWVCVSGVAVAGMCYLRWRALVIWVRGLGA